VPERCGSGTRKQDLPYQYGGLGVKCDEKEKIGRGRCTGVGAAVEGKRASKSEGRRT